jgi:hypothetical protein
VPWDEALKETVRRFPCEQPFCEEQGSEEQQPTKSEAELGGQAYQVDSDGQTGSKASRARAKRVVD